MKKKGFLSLFAQLEKSPEYIHTYKITLLSLWNAATKTPLESILQGLRKI